MALTRNIPAGPGFEDPTKISLKVGYTVDVPRRMAQWRKQCPSREHILRGYWPGGLVNEHPDTKDRNFVSATGGPGPMGPRCRLVERLVHLELSDLVVNRQYMEPDFMSRTKLDILSPPKIAPKSSAGKILLEHQQCIDCACLFEYLEGWLIDYIGGMVHREIFTFARVGEGIYKGKEWDLIVKPVIEKWGECT